MKLYLFYSGRWSVFNVTHAEKIVIIDVDDQLNSGRLFVFTFVAPD